MVKGRRVRRAVILAAGLGTRMRQSDPEVQLSPEQARAAASGIKALIPIGGRPFIEHTIEVLAGCGIDSVCLVLAAATEPLRSHCETALASDPTRLHYAYQAAPHGTADALLAAERFAGSEPFLLLNSDNFYPSALVNGLLALPGPGVAAIDVRRLLERSDTNLTEEKLRRYALIEPDDNGNLAGILEKPDASTWAARAARLERGSTGNPLLINVNAWRFSPEIFDATRRISRSERSELELPDAVLCSIDRSQVTYSVHILDCPVLDLSTRRDIPVVDRLLSGRSHPV